MNDQSISLCAPVELPQTKSGSYKDIGFDNSVTSGGMALMPVNFGELVTFAELMARAGSMIPKHFRNEPGACMALAQQALRWGMDPFAVAMKTYKVGENIAFEAQMIAAVVMTRAAIAEEPDYSYEGEGDTLRCTVSVKMKSGKVLTYQSPKKGDITVKNSPLWKSDPQQQLGYYSIRNWARRHQPHVIMGIVDRDEAAVIEQSEMRDVTPTKAVNRLQEKLEAGRAAAGDAPVAGFNAESVAEQVADKAAEVDPPHDPETGEIIDGQAETAQEAAAEASGTAEAEAVIDETVPWKADASEGQEAEAEAEAELSPEEKVLEIARGMAMQGRKAFDKWFNAQKTDVLDMLGDHTGKLMKAARAVDQAAAGGK